MINISALHFWPALLNSARNELETVFAPEIQSLAQANKLTCDETLKLREQNYQTADTVYIFEFKLSGNGTADDAIAQIKKKQYDET